MPLIYTERIAIIGHFGGKEIFNDGQTVKTIAVYEALQRYGIKNLECIDTYFVRKNPVKFIWQFVKMLFSCKKIILIVSVNGRRMFFPILYYMSRFGKEIYHYEIGGFAQEISEHFNWRKYLSAFKGNWLESVEVVKKMQQMGVDNAVYMPNFKKLDILMENELQNEYAVPFRLCTFSRVIKEKGIEDAISAVRVINKDAGAQLVTLDIYGPAEESYLIKLNKLIKGNSACRYCGIVPANESVTTLKEYYALLFPTYHSSEGMPGTIIDALSAGLPVIARRWQYCDEMLTHKETGYIYNFDEPEKLKDMILYAITHVQETVQMKKNCIQEAKKYSEECVIERIAEQMGICKREIK